VRFEELGQLKNLMTSSGIELLLYKNANIKTYKTIILLLVL
jgi:hypothetical protein